MSDVDGGRVVVVMTTDVGGGTAMAAVVVVVNFGMDDDMDEEESLSSLSGGNNFQSCSGNDGRSGGRRLLLLLLLLLSVSSFLFKCGRGRFLFGVVVTTGLVRVLLLQVRGGSGRIFGGRVVVVVVSLLLWTRSCTVCRMCAGLRRSTNNTSRAVM